MLLLYFRWKKEKQKQIWRDKALLPLAAANATNYLTECFSSHPFLYLVSFSARYSFNLRGCTPKYNPNASSGGNHRHRKNKSMAPVMRTTARPLYVRPPSPLYRISRIDIYRSIFRIFHVLYSPRVISLKKFLIFKESNDFKFP